jgi:hypothetical protein
MRKGKESQSDSFGSRWLAIGVSLMTERAPITVSPLRLVASDRGFPLRYVLTQACATEVQ